jgi:phospholipase D1/2
MSFVFDKLHKTVHEIAGNIKDQVSGKEDAPQQGPQNPQPAQEYHSGHRFLSFAPQRQGNDIKWYVDGSVVLQCEESENDQY